MTAKSYGEIWRKRLHLTGGRLIGNGEIEQWQRTGS